MIELKEDELVLNIISQTERAVALVEHADFRSDEYSAASVIAAMAGNIFDSAVTAAVLEDPENSRSDCYTRGATLLLGSDAISAETKGFIRQIRERRSAGGEFSADSLLDFLNAVDCFMFWFFKNSRTLARMKAEGTVSGEFVSIRNTVEKKLRKSRVTREESPAENDIASLLRRNNELLELLLNETRELRRSLYRDDSTESPEQRSAQDSKR